MADLNYPMLVSALAAEDGGGFLAFAPDLKGCVGDGETPEEAVADLVKAVDEWISEATRLGREIPKPNAVASRAARQWMNLHALV